jgi:hypothetical protein
MWLIGRVLAGKGIHKKNTCYALIGHILKKKKLSFYNFFQPKA